MESPNLKIPESSQTPGNEFYGLQRNIGSWANSPILQIRKPEFRERLLRSQGPGSLGHLWTLSQQARIHWAYFAPQAPKKRAGPAPTPNLACSLGKQPGIERGEGVKAADCSLGEILCSTLTHFIFYLLCPGVVGPLSFLPATPPGLFHFLFYRVSFPAPTLPSWGPGHLGPLGIGWVGTLLTSAPLSPSLPAAPPTGPPKSPKSPPSS